MLGLILGWDTTIMIEVSNSFPQFVQAHWVTVKLLLALASTAPGPHDHFTVGDMWASRFIRPGKCRTSILYQTTATSIHIPLTHSMSHGLNNDVVKQITSIERQSHYAQLTSHVSCASSQTCLVTACFLTTLYQINKQQGPTSATILIFNKVFICFGHVPPTTTALRTDTQH
jgi:hypothetical protein